jgi:CheY-like chemotaxis protein
MEPKTQLIDAITKLIQAFSSAAWPGIVFYIIFSYRRQIATLIESAKSREFTMEVGGQKLSMKEANQQQQIFINDLQEQLNEIRKKIEESTPIPPLSPPEEDLDFSPNLSTGGSIPPSISSSTNFNENPTPIVPTATPYLMPNSNAVLWVDDNPKNNSYFIDLLQNRGYRVDLALSTSDALSKINNNTYRLILSDMGRTEKGKYIKYAGMVLLETIRNQGETLPLVFFCTSKHTIELLDKVKESGGYAITSSQTELRAILDDLAPNTTA